MPLQLLLRRQPGWGRHATVVLDKDEPQGVVLWVNALAYRAHVRTGMRYAEALSVAPGLRGGVVPSEEIATAVTQVTDLLRKGSPVVEPCRWEGEPGVFWLGMQGLLPAHPCLRTWAEGLRGSLRGEGFGSSAAVGFDRFAAFALARQLSFTRGGRKVLLCATAADERARSARVPLDLLNIAPKLRDSLERLGIREVGGLRQLPAGGLQERFGKAGHDLHLLVDGARPVPVQGVDEVSPVQERYEADPECPEIDGSGLLFLIVQSLGRLCVELRERCEAIKALRLTFLLEKVEPVLERLEPAEPTLQEAHLVDLVRLRLERMSFEAPLLGFELEAEPVAAPKSQRQLFAEKPRRDLRAANRALARIRAEFGEEAVLRAELRDGHLPEARVTWHRLLELRLAEPSPLHSSRLVRRLSGRAMPLGSHRDPTDGWFLGGLAGGAVQDLTGPFVISGGWWHRTQHREYYFVETRGGHLLWVYYDRPRRRWFLQGTVE